MEVAKVEMSKPFEPEEELQEKSARLTTLNALLNMDGKADAAPEQDAEKPSIRDQLKTSGRPGNGIRHHHSQEER